jgi:transposase
MPVPQMQVERNLTPPPIAPIKLQLPKSMSVTEKTPPKPVKSLQKHKIKSQNSQDGQHELNSQLSTQSSHNADGTPKKRKSSKAFVETDYRDRPYLKKHDRKRMDPKVALASMLEDILLATKKIPLSDAFHFPVDTKTYVDYQKFITSPIDLETMRSKIRANCYLSRAEFREDYSLIRQNCGTYNGPNHPLSSS